jgi:hypothetical protein
MRKLLLTAVIAVGSSLAFAAGEAGTGTTAADGATTMGKPADRGAGDAYLAKEFWSQHAKGGYMSKEDAMQFKGADGKSVDMQKLDADSDGRISEREWTTYQQTAGAAGIGSPESGAQKSDSNGKGTR